MRCALIHGIAHEKLSSYILWKLNFFGWSFICNMEKEKRPASGGGKVGRPLTFVTVALALWAIMN